MTSVNESIFWLDIPKTNSNQSSGRFIRIDTITRVEVENHEKSETGLVLLIISTDDSNRPFVLEFDNYVKAIQFSSNVRNRVYKYHAKGDKK